MPCKILEHIIFNHIMGHLDAHHVFVNYQHGFRQGHSCERDNYTYTMMGHPITSVTQHKYLGVELDSKLTWNEHISAITLKANSSLGFLRRNLYNCPEQIKTQAYYSLVRPHLECACSVWDPHTQKSI